MIKKRKQVAVFTAFILLITISRVYGTAELPEGHSFQGWVTVQEAGCETDGLRTNTCLYCGMVVQDVIPALGHDWQLGIKQDPTCTEDGYQLYSCTRCGKEKVESLPALGHDFVASVIQPTCTADGKKVETCTRCGKEQIVETLPALGHHLTVSEILPTEKKEGTRITTCTRCDYKLVETLPALGEQKITASTSSDDNVTVNGNEDVQMDTTTPLHAASILSPQFEETEQAVTTEQKTTSQDAAAAVADIGGSNIQVAGSQSNIKKTEAWKPDTIDIALGGSCIAVTAAGIAALWPYMNVFKWYRRKKISALKKLYGG